MEQGAGVGAPPAGATNSRVTQHLQRLPLRVRLVMIVVLLMLGALAVTSVATTTLLRHYLVTRMDQQLRQAAALVAQAPFDQLVQRRSDLGPFTLPNTYTVRIMPVGSGYAIDLTNQVADKDDPTIPRLALHDGRVRSGRPFTVGSQQNQDTSWRVAAGATKDGSATFAVAVPLTPVERTVSQLWVYTALLAVAVTIACGALGWFAVRRAFRPLSQIEDTAAAIAGGDLTRRIPPTYAHDEVATLATSLNVMLSQVEQSFTVREAAQQRMRQFLGDVSHELRTPLATVRGYAELFRQGAVHEPADVASAMRRIEDEATRMGGLVEDLLLLTRLDNQRPEQLGSVDLTVLAGDAAQDARALAPQRRIRLLGLDGTLRPTLVVGDEARLRQVLTNLLANAINHTPEGTPIEIAVGTLPPLGTPAGHHGRRACIEVRDHGHGIPLEEAPKLFERFYRTDPSRTRGQGGGTGLGLSIVAAIVASHGGHVGIAPTPGGGATFMANLPVTGGSEHTQGVGT